MNNLALLTNEESGFQVRMIEIKGEPWFVSKDAAENLGYEWKGVSGTIPHVPEEWRGICSVQTPSGMQDMSVLSEQGLYFFLSRSDKPKALPFQKWIAGEVLPSIRKNGKYVSGKAQRFENRGFNTSSFDMPSFDAGLKTLGDFPGQVGNQPAG